jgi:hypothetical protein
MSRWLVLGAVAGFAALVAAGAMAALQPSPAPGHNRFHIGCADHNHGPKWHAGHGRSLVPVSRFARPAEDDEAPPKAGR